MPLNMDEAVRLQSDGLEHAYGSRTTSTRVSRLNTPLNSGRQTPADGKSRYRIKILIHFRAGPVGSSRSLKCSIALSMTAKQV